ncbi:MAG: group II intron reverse transcriptase/maturase [Terriglobia bacterium]
MKPPNNGAQASAEVVEGRASIQENSVESSTRPTPSGERVSQGLGGVRRVARERKQERFTALLHHLTVDLLRESYYALRRNAAPGVDGVRWSEYEDGLEDRLQDLQGRVHRGAYRAQPSRRVYIPKADGRQRPLGIAAREDKIVQQAVVTILNQIYEVDFRGFSYGFRPGRSPHQALDALNVGIQRRRVNWILDADIRGFFDNMDHEWTMEFVAHRVADNRVLRLIRKWLKAGVSEDGEWSETKVGTPQGAVVSPLLANVYLHYVFDLWAEVWREKVAQGDMIVVRYADDLVVGFEHRAEAERFLREFQERLAKFGLEMHPEKTRLIEFGRFAQVNRQRRGEGKAETFTFLGFTHCCGTNSKGQFEV